MKYDVLNFAISGTCDDITAYNNSIQPCAFLIDLFFSLHSFDLQFIKIFKSKLEAPNLEQSRIMTTSIFYKKKAMTVLLFNYVLLFFLANIEIFVKNSKETLL